MMTQDNLQKYVRSAEQADIAYLAPLLREIDVKELSMVGFENPITALTVGFKDSELCFTVLSPTTRLPIAMFGIVIDPDAPFNTVWLLGTDEIKEHAGRFLKYSKRWVNTFTELFAPIGNVILGSNDMSARWLEWCGFTIINVQVTKDDLLLTFIKEE